MLTEELWPRTSTFNSLLWYFREHRCAELVVQGDIILSDSETFLRQTMFVVGTTRGLNFRQPRKQA